MVIVDGARLRVLFVALWATLLTRARRGPLRSSWSFTLGGEPLRALPPCFVSLGALEGPHDDILQFVKELRAMGVDCTLHVAEDMPHNPAFFGAYHPSGRAAFDATVAFVRRCTAA